MMRSIFTLSILIQGSLLSMNSCSLSNDKFETSEEGLQYKIHHNAAGPEVAEGQLVKLNMAYYTNDNKELYNTWAQGDTAMIRISPNVFKADLMHGLKLLSEGDSATFMISADSIFGKMFRIPLPDSIAAGSDLTFRVKVESVMTQEEYEMEMQRLHKARVDQEIQTIQQYAEANELNVVSTQSGLHYVITSEGTGAQPQPGQTVRVHYTGKLLNGQVFDSSYERDEPIEFPIGQGRVIRGWDEGIALLNKGGQATLLIPSHLAYGQSGSGPIPSNSILLFEVELLAIN